MEVRSERESSDGNIRDEFSQAKELLRERYVSKDEDKIWRSHPGSHLTGSSSSHSIFLKESGRSCFAKRVYNSTFVFNDMLVCQTLRDRN